jgi:hypothetical protein
MSWEHQPPEVAGFWQDLVKPADDACTVLLSIRSSVLWPVFSRPCAILTALTDPNTLMWTGRPASGLCNGAIFVARIVLPARWLRRQNSALETSAFPSLVRPGSLTLNTGSS